MKKRPAKIHTKHRIHHKRTVHTWKTLWIMLGVFTLLITALSSSYIFLTNHTDVLGAQIAMVTTGGSASKPSCTGSGKYCLGGGSYNYCNGKIDYTHNCSIGCCTPKPTPTCQQYTKTAPKPDHCVGNKWCTTITGNIGNKCSSAVTYGSCIQKDGHCNYHAPTPTPTPTPSWHQAENCISKAFPYQVTGPYLNGYSSVTTTQNGTIKASVCTDEIYDTTRKVHLVEIKTNVVFDQLAKNAGASCIGNPSSDPLSDYNSDGSQAKDPGAGARLALYFNNSIFGLNHTGINGKGTPVDPTKPDERQPGVRCPGSQTVYQYSPDAAWNHRMDRGSKLLGRLVFGVNFGSYGSPITIDLYGPQITVK